MFDLEIAHIPGVNNTAADALSRLAWAIPAESLRTYDCKEDYREDPAVARKYFHSDGSWLHPDAYHMGRVWVQDRILVPRRRIREVLTRSHADVVQGYWGSKKTYDLLARKFIFRNMKA